MLIRASILSARASKLDCSPIVFGGGGGKGERGNDSYTHFMLWLAARDLLWSLQNITADGAMCPAEAGRVSG